MCSSTGKRRPDIAFLNTEPPHRISGGSEFCNLVIGTTDSLCNLQPQ